MHLFVHEAEIAHKAVTDWTGHGECLAAYDYGEPFTYTSKKKRIESIKKEEEGVSGNGAFFFFFTYCHISF
jgi:hypothetical protein